MPSTPSNPVTSIRSVLPLCHREGFEDLRVGDVFRAPSRTLTDAHPAAFSIWSCFGVKVAPEERSWLRSASRALIATASHRSASVIEQMVRKVMDAALTSARVPCVTFNISRSALSRQNQDKKLC